MNTLLRALALSVVWLILTGADPAALPAGVLAVLLATFLSLRLAPPSALRPNMLGLARFLPHFLWRSFLGGIDVAGRAFSRRPRLDPGFVRYRVALPNDMRRSILSAEISLLPGTLAAGYDGDTLLIHCLDRRQPVPETIMAEERSSGDLAYEARRKRAK